MANVPSQATSPTATIIMRLLLLLSFLGLTQAFLLPTTTTRGPQPLQFFGGGAKAQGSKKTGGPFTITVKQSFFKDAQLKVEKGPVNLRKELLADKIDMYPLQGKVYNCGGAGVCGTCAVDVLSGADNLSPKSPNETRTLGKKPASFRLACCTRAQGDVTIKVKP